LRRYQHRSARHPSVFCQCSKRALHPFRWYRV
jgi:hypothetical protein